MSSAFTSLFTVIEISYDRYGPQVYTDYESCREALSSIKEQFELITDPDPAPKMVLSHRGNHMVITSTPSYNMEFIVTGLNTVCKEEMTACFRSC